MNSCMTFRDCEVTIKAQEDGTVRLTVAGGANNVASVILGGDAANLIGTELERAALYLRRIERLRAEHKREGATHEPA